MYDTIQPRECLKCGEVTPAASRTVIVCPMCGAEVQPRERMEYWPHVEEAEPVPRIASDDNDWNPYAQVFVVIFVGIASAGLLLGCFNWMTR